MRIQLTLLLLSSAWLISCGLGLQFGAFSFGGLVDITEVGKDNVRLLWNAGSGVASYVVFDTTSGAPTEIANAESDRTSYTITGLQPSTAYKFLVRALDSQGRFDSNSSEKEVTTLAVTDTSFLPSSSSLKLWVIASVGITKNATNEVSAWEDQSGNSHHFTQSMDSKRPRWVDGAIAQRPAVSFDGGVDEMAAAVGFAYDPHTAFIVLKPNVVVSLKQALLADQGLGAVGYGLAGAASKFALLRASSTESLTTLSVLTSPQILTVRSAGAAPGALAAFFWRNGTAAEAPVAAQAPSAPASSVKLGIDSDNNYYSGMIAEVLIFETQLDDSSRIDVEQYLSGRYAINLRR